MVILSAGIGSLLERIKGANPKRVPAEDSGAPSQTGRIYPGMVGEDFSEQVGEIPGIVGGFASE
jgi:hypothetical protein